jgi:pilus assembly protein Flp/PilA
VVQDRARSDLAIAVWVCLFEVKLCALPVLTSRFATSEYGTHATISDENRACIWSKRGESEMKAIRKFLRDESGLTATEYAIAGGLVGAAVIGAFTALGGSITGVITFISGAINP